MPFGSNCEYPDFEACVTANQDKDDPQSYCAAIMRETEEGCASRSVRMLRTKVYRSSTKVLDEARGIVSAIVSSESVDRDGDVIRAEGWSIDNFMRHPVLLSSHDYHSLRSQIGEWQSMEIRGTQMHGVARFFIGRGNDEADWAFELAKEKSLAFSVGFIPDMEKAVPLSKSDPMNGGMEFNGQELLEVSAVTVPSNPDALQRMVKSPNLQPVLREIAEERLGEAVDDTTEATKHTLSSEDLELIVDQVLDRLDQASADDERGPGYKPPRKQEDEDEEPDDEEADDEAEDDTEAEQDEDEEDEDKDEEKSEFDAYAVALAAAEQALQEASNE